jgi:uncharacterized protein (DUF2252 family)
MKTPACRMVCLALSIASLVGCGGAAQPSGTAEDLTARALGVASRTSYVVAEIQAQNAPLDAADRAEKYTAMKQSPFVFFRGTNHLFWKDLGASPELSDYGATPSTRAFLGGDMHVNNTGSIDDDQGDVVFALNDFDEALIGDYQLDVWRMATSLVLVARERGVFGASEEAAFVDAFTEGYLECMEAFAGTNDERTRQFVQTNTYGLLDDFLANVATKESRAEMLDDWTVLVGGVRRFAMNGHPDLAPVSSSVEADLVAKIPGYRSTLSGGGVSLPSSYFQVKSLAKRLHAGVGSLGSPRYYVLIEGATTSQSDDRILDVKAEGAPSGWAYADAAGVALTNTASGGNMAFRTVLAQKALGYRVDDHLGWMKLTDGQTYAVRERSPFKETFPVKNLTTITRFTKMAEQWGQMLAAHHARADKDWDASVLAHSVDGAIEALVDGDHEGFRAKVRAIVVPYADQVAFDYQSFLAGF